MVLGACPSAWLGGWIHYAATMDLVELSRGKVVAVAAFVRTTEMDRLADDQIARVYLDDL